MAISTPEIRKSHKVLLTHEANKRLRIGKILFDRDHGAMLEEAFAFATAKGWKVGEAIKVETEKAKRGF